jgi:hypothetical protein
MGYRIDALFIALLFATIAGASQPGQPGFWLMVGGAVFWFLEFCFRVWLHTQKHARLKAAADHLLAGVRIALREERRGDR